ncbi:MAG: macro domain-containing protein [Ignavibacteriales bacterium]|nr:macro domain-containing protein [Ignavibacteriales bacterium]
MELYLVDNNYSLVKELENAFSNFPEVKVHYGNILDVAEFAFVSPANSFGHMDGGIDLVYSNYFGWDLERKVKNTIDQLTDAMLPVGSSIIVETNHPKIPFLIVSPTMRMPEVVPASNAYFAMSAILKITHQNSDKIKKVYCPGLGTGVGHIPFDKAANEMANAYSKYKLEHKN